MSRYGLVDPSVNFMTGAMQGFQTVDNYYARKHSQGLQDAANERAIATEQRQQQSHDIALDKVAQGEDVNRLQGIQHKIESQQKLSLDELDWMEHRFNINVDSMMGNDYDTALETLKGAAKDLSIANTPEGLKAFNTVFERELSKGSDTLPNGDKILKREVSRLVPGKQPGTFAIGVRVTARNADQQEYTYDSQITEQRSGDAKADPNVKQIPIEEAIKNIQGKALLSKALKQAKPLVEAAILERGGKLRDGKDVKYGYEEFKTKNEKGEEVIETWLTANGKRVERVAEGSRFSEREGGSGGSGSSSNMNGVEKMISKALGGQVDPKTGQISFGGPDSDKTRSQYMEMTARGQELLSAGKVGTYGQAARMAFIEVMKREPTKTEEEAMIEVADEFNNKAKGTSVLGIDTGIGKNVDGKNLEQYQKENVPKVIEASIPANQESNGGLADAGKGENKKDAKQKSGGIYQFETKDGKKIQVLPEVFDSIPENKARTFKTGELAGRTFAKLPDGTVQELNR